MALVLTKQNAVHFTPDCTPLINNTLVITYNGSSYIILDQHMDTIEVNKRKIPTKKGYISFIEFIFHLYNNIIDSRGNCKSVIDFRFLCWRLDCR